MSDKLIAIKDLARQDDPHLGYLFHNPDTGTEWAESHPVESGECDDAEDVRPATLIALRNELFSAWEDAAEQRQGREAALQSQQYWSDEASRSRDLLAAMKASLNYPDEIARALLRTRGFSDDHIEDHQRRNTLSWQGVAREADAILALIARRDIESPTASKLHVGRR